MARRVTLAVVALALTVVGCTSGDDAAGAGAITLQVFADPDEIKAYNTLIAAFEQQEPEIDVRLIPVDGQDEHQAKLSAAFAAGSPPDLFLINYRRFGQFAARGVLEPTEDRVDLDGLYPVAVDAFRFDGKVQCAPQNVSTPVVYFNTELFAEARVPGPEPGWTWDDLVEAAKQLHRGGVTGVGFEPSLNRFAPFVWQAGGEVVDDFERPSRVSLLEPPDRQALQFLTDLQHRHDVTLSLAEAEAEDPESRFANGTLAMLIESRRATTGLRKVEGLEWDVAPLPVHPVRREPAAMLHSDAYCVSRASERKDDAMKFVAFALGEEGAQILARTGRTVPSRKSVAAGDAFLDASQPPRSARVFLDQIAAIRRFPTTANWNEIETRADVVVEEWFFGKEPPEALGLEIDLATGELFEAEG